MAEIPTLKGSWPWPWIRSYSIPSSSTSTYVPNFIEIKGTFCGRTDKRTFETHFIRLTRRRRPKKLKAVVIWLTTSNTVWCSWYKDTMLDILDAGSAINSIYHTSWCHDGGWLRHSGHKSLARTISGWYNHRCSVEPRWSEQSCSSSLRCWSSSLSN